MLKTDRRSRFNLKSVLEFFWNHFEKYFEDFSEGPLTMESEIEFFLLNDPMYVGLLPKRLTEDFELVKSGALDSIGIFNLVAFLEKKFSITIDAADLVESNFASIKAISAFVRAREK